MAVRSKRHCFYVMQNDLRKPGHRASSIKAPVARLASPNEAWSATAESAAAFAPALRPIPASNAGAGADRRHRTEFQRKARRAPRIDQSHSISFSKATLADHSNLLRLMRAYYRYDGLQFRPIAVATALTRLLKSRSLGRLWLMRDGSKAMGYAILTFNYDLEFGGFEGIITDLFIADGYRGQGLGKRALAIVCNYCRSAGIGAVELQVEEHNEAARDFYLHCGFRKLPRMILSKDWGV
jgi:GNAT superfamily N-acetyltransferase